MEGRNTAIEAANANPHLRLFKAKIPPTIVSMPTGMPTITKEAITIKAWPTALVIPRSKGWRSSIIRATTGNIPYKIACAMYRIPMIIGVALLFNQTPTIC